MAFTIYVPQFSGHIMTNQQVKWLQLPTYISIKKQTTYSKIYTIYISRHTSIVLCQIVVSWFEICLLSKFFTLGCFLQKMKSWKPSVNWLVSFWMKYLTRFSRDNSFVGLFWKAIYIHIQPSFSGNGTSVWLTPTTEWFGNRLRHDL